MIPKIGGGHKNTFGSKLLIGVVCDIVQTLVALLHLTVISPLLGSGCTVGGTAKRIDCKETFDDGDEDYLEGLRHVSLKNFYLKTIANEQHPTSMMSF